MTQTNTTQNKEELKPMNNENTLLEFNTQKNITSLKMLKSQKNN